MQHYLYVERDFGAGQKNAFQKQALEVFSWTSFLFLNSILNQEAVESITLLKSYWYSASEPVFNASDWIRLLRLIKQLFNHELTLKGLFFLFFLKLQTQRWFSQSVAALLLYCMVALRGACICQAYTVLPAAVVWGVLVVKGSMSGCHHSASSVGGVKSEHNSPRFTPTRNLSGFTSLFPWITQSECHCGTLLV